MLQSEGRSRTVVDSLQVRRRRSTSIAGTVRSRAARELRQRIIMGELAPGSVLDINAITEEFGTSRTPVREAILELSYEGLVDITPRSRVIVLGVTAQDVIDSFTLLATLSGRAAQWAAERMQPETLSRLEELNQTLHQAALGNPQDLVDINWAFHHTVNLAADSPRLLTLLKQAVRVVPTDFFQRFPEHEDTAHREHEAMLEAFRRKDGELARRLTEKHIEYGGHRIVEWIATHETSADQGVGSALGSAALSG
jgi:DNA-binding GntR family transcriptional regulator